MLDAPKSSEQERPASVGAGRGTMTQPHDPRLVGALLVQTAATGLIDAVSYLALGHVLTANMTGNIVFLAFAIAEAPALAIPRPAVSLLPFLAGAAAGGRQAALRGIGQR